VPAINKRRRKTQPPGETPRRSNDLERRTRKKVVRALDIIDENEGIDQQARDEYAKLFGHKLSDSHLQALTALFNWSLPDDFGQGADEELLS
jgi:hypothetical protein